MQSARVATRNDLTALLALFAVSEVSGHAEPQARAEEIWTKTLAREGLFVFVSEVQSNIVSTCMLITVPNLLRRGQQHGVIENVVTHRQHQGQGHGRAVMEAALTEAWRQNCYHVLLQSGRANPHVHRFYEACGFVPGIRTAYAMRNPETGSV